jgi:hypothetical protein
MKAQERFPYDSTVVGLNGIYHPIGGNSFYINSNCLLATDKIITIGMEYIVFENPTEIGIKMLDVKLVDCYYRKSIINLIVQDSRSQRVFTLHHCIECLENDCKWVLVDLDYFIDLLNAKAVKDYCADCINNLKQHIAEINSNVSGDDLLEFEF